MKKRIIALLLAICLIVFSPTIAITKAQEVLTATSTTDKPTSNFIPNNVTMPYDLNLKVYFGTILYYYVDYTNYGYTLNGINSVVANAWGTHKYYDIDLKLLNNDKVYHVDNAIDMQYKGGAGTGVEGRRAFAFYCLINFNITIPSSDLNNFQNFGVEFKIPLDSEITITPDRVKGTFYHILKNTNYPAYGPNYVQFDFEKNSSLPYNINGLSFAPNVYYYAESYDWSTLNSKMNNTITFNSNGLDYSYNFVGNTALSGQQKYYDFNEDFSLTNFSIKTDITKWLDELNNANYFNTDTLPEWLECNLPVRITLYDSSLYNRLVSSSVSVSVNSPSYQVCDWYDIPCHLGNALSYFVYEFPLTKGVIDLGNVIYTFLAKTFSFLGEFSSLGILFSFGVIILIIILLFKFM